MFASTRATFQVLLPAAPNRTCRANRTIGSSYAKIVIAETSLQSAQMRRGIADQFPALAFVFEVGVFIETLRLI
jgi:hypothetical protein